MGSLFVADVISWDSRNIWVLCPFCESLHRHSMPSDSSYGTQNRVPHCDAQISTYELRFPFDLGTNKVSFEIDKDARRYVTVGIDVQREEVVEVVVNEEEEEEEEEGDASSVASLLKDLKLNDGDSKSDSRSEEGVLNQASTAEPSRVELTDLEDDSSVATSECLCGNIPAVRQFLSRTNDLGRFFGRRDEKGNILLTDVAAERFPDMLALLLEHGANRYIDSRNRTGRTPLMEAALWGRLENTKLLLQHGANPDIRDRQGRNAVDFARQHPSNEEERKRRAPAACGEIRRVAELQRGGIVALLSHEAPQSRLGALLTSSRSQPYELFQFHHTAEGETVLCAPVEKSYELFHFHHAAEDEIVLCAPVEKFAIPSTYKTIAVLARGPPFPEIVAMSGYSHDESWSIVDKGSSSVLIGGQRWTDEVFCIARLIQHTLTSEARYDRGRQGSFAACHAEKQLIAWFLRHHFFLPDELDPDNVVQRIWERPAGGLLDSPFTPMRYPRATEPVQPGAKVSLRDLYRCEPPVHLEEITILVSRPICRDCSGFMRQVESAFSLQIHARYAMKMARAGRT